MSRTDGPCWLYGVVAADDLGAVPLPARGVLDAPVTTLVSGELAAVVSPIGPERVRSSRAQLTAHHEVVEHLAAFCAVLPVAFGMVAESGRQLMFDLLESQEASLALMLAEMAGKDEWRVTARYVGDVVLRDAVDKEPAIRRLRGRARTYGDQIRLGELVAAAVEQVRAGDAASLIRTLGAQVVAVEELSRKADDVAFHAAVLVDRRRSKAFDRVLGRLARESEGRLTFQVVGPLAPWDFVGDPGRWAPARVTGRR